MDTPIVPSSTNKKVVVAQRLDEVVEAMFKVELPPFIKYRADSKKLSHLLSNQNLMRLLVSTFQITDQCIRLDLIMDALRYRLDLLEVDIVSFEELVSQQNGNGQQTYADITPDQVDLEGEVTSIELAEDIFERLTDRHRQVLALKLSLVNPTLEEIGEALDVSKSSVHNDLTIITQHISAMCTSQEEAENVLSILSELCMHHLEETSQ